MSNRRDKVTAWHYLACPATVV